MSKPKRYQGYIFDLDGTLIDSKKDIALATNATIRHMGGLPLADEHIYEFVGHGVRDLIRGALQNINGANPDEALDFFNQYYLEHCLDHTRFFPGVEDKLRQLKSGGAVFAILTNKPQIFADKIIKGLGAAHYFIVNQGAESGLPNKPHVQTTESVINKIGTQKSDTLMVGDSDVDLAVARNAGLDCVLALYGFTKRSEIEKFADQARLIEKFADL